MKKHFRSIKAIVLFVLSFVMLSAMSVCASASEAAESIIKFDIDPKPVIATVALVFGLLIALILALVFLSRHISETKNRISRLSKIRSEDTVQLYDDLDEEKWHNSEVDEKPRDVQIKDDYSKPSSVKTVAVSNKDKPDDKKEPHGPVPERDMPGFDPSVYNKQDDGIKPVSPYDPAPDFVASGYGKSPAASKASEVQAASAMADQAAMVNSPFAFAPRVIKPDSDVEIIMRDSAAPSSSEDNSLNLVCNINNPAAESEAQVETSTGKVKAFRRRGKVPGLVTRATPGPALALQRRMATAASDPLDRISSVAGRRLPGIGIRTLSIGPKTHNEDALYNSVQNMNTEEDYSLNLKGLPVNEEPVAETEIIREAPVIDIAEPGADKDIGIDDISVRLVPPLGSAEDTQVRTLNDVLDELENVGEDDVTELEAIDKPVREEELLFLGSDSLTDDVDTEDDVFANEDGEARMLLNGKYTLVHYKTSFLARFIQSEEKIQDYYSVIKNILMSYKDVESSVGWACETFTHGGEICAKVNVVDKMLLLYLALDPERYHNYKYNYTYAYHKYKNSRVPMFVKIKSDRALKYALDLVVALMNDLSVESGEVPDIDYRRPYEAVPALIDRGLIKIVSSNGDEAEDVDDISELTKDEIAEKISNIDNSEGEDLSSGAVFDFDEPKELEPMVITVDDVPVSVVDDPSEKTVKAEEPSPTIPKTEDEPIHPIVHVDAQNADLLLSDEDAIASIEIVEDEKHTSGTGKVYEINLDTICDAFEDGDTVDLEALKSKRLVSQNAERIKVLARGTMTKTLTIYADRFSLQAVKMITLAGGHAEQYK